MTNQNWGAPHNQYPPAPYYAPAPPPQKNSNAGMIIVSVIAALLAIALAAFLAFYFGSNGSKNAASESGMTSVEQQPSEQARPTVTQTVSAPAPAAEKPAPEPKQSSKKTYSDWSVTDSEVTTPPFAANVFSAFVAKYNSTGNPNVTLYGVYSPTTGLKYDMTCRDRGSQVVCTGGNNAAVYIS